MNRFAIISILLFSSIFISAFSANIFSAPRTNLALDKTAIADSYVGARTPAMAVDGINSGESRWENNYIDGRPDSMKGNAWIYVDLGTRYLVDSVAIYWEHSGSGKYAIQEWDSTIALPSNNDTGWTTLLIDTTLTYTDAVQRCLSFLKLPPRETRYVRMHSYKRLWNPGWGISIYEFEVYGNAITAVRPKSEMRRVDDGLSVTCARSGARISFGRMQARPLSAEILSPSGQLVCRCSGSVEAFWNYKDLFNRSVTNGVYLVKIDATGQMYQKKIAVYR
ncbi:MAG TPA: discoidin domain-containing protein [Chitinivibrionales bacterium]|nr:discoidin domain-containing protein [Chitinivibrionales bacterium]